MVKLEISLDCALLPDLAMKSRKDFDEGSDEKPKNNRRQLTKEKEKLDWLFLATNYIGHLRMCTQFTMKTVQK